MNDIEPKDRPRNTDLNFTCNLKQFSSFEDGTCAETVQQEDTRSIKIL
jgi:hypothetical protein